MNAQNTQDGRVHGHMWAVSGPKEVFGGSLESHKGPGGATQFKNANKYKPSSMKSEKIVAETVDSNHHIPDSLI